MNAVGQANIDQRPGGLFLARFGIDPGIDQGQLDVA